MITAGCNKSGGVTVVGLLDVLRTLGRFARCRKAAVSIVAALSLPSLIAFSSLVAEYGHGLLVQAQDQRVADLAAYAGGLAYNANGYDDAMRWAARAVAARNGVSSSQVTVSLVNSPTGDGYKAVYVKVATTVPIYLAQVVGASTSLPVSAVSYAELATQNMPCVLATSSNAAGVQLSGSATVTADGCTVSSNASETVPCGSEIMAKAVTYGSAAPTNPCNNIVPPPGQGSVPITQRVQPDPLASDAGVLSATSHLTSVSSLAAPTTPAVTSGGDVNFGGSTSTVLSQLAADGCSGALSGSVWTVTCSGAGPFNFGNVTTSGTVNFNTSGSTTTTYNFSGGITVSSGTVNFGAGTYNVAQGLNVTGGTTANFTDGTFNIGRMTSKCNSTYYSICNQGQLLNFAGTSVFNIASGVYSSGSSQLVMGSGSNNSFWVGPSSGGTSFYLGGGSYTVLGDATGASSVFKLIGDLDVAANAGCLTVSAAAQHDINGNFMTAGATTLGSGIYSVTGYVALGGNGGGNSQCKSQSVGITGTNVTIALGGASTPSNGPCAGQTFCVANGYDDVNLSGPTSGTTRGLVVVGPTANTGSALFAEGANTTTLSGALYFPQGGVALTGSAAIGGGAGQCLQIVGTQVTLSGGSLASSNCLSTSNNTATVVLVS
ncbi:MAG TPA: hypothetical protein VHO06_03425 [Polyangia bacterium]|nr:hypothetical protein [Polyangia bacterium]